MPTTPSARPSSQIGPPMQSGGSTSRDSVLPGPLRHAQYGGLVQIQCSEASGPGDGRLLLPGCLVCIGYPARMQDPGLPWPGLQLNLRSAGADRVRGVSVEADRYVPGTPRIRTGGPMAFRVSFSDSTDAWISGDTTGKLFLLVLFSFLYHIRTP